MLSEDKVSKGYVRHTTNPDYKFGNGEKDED